MPIPVYTTNLQDITLAESTTSWSALGGGAAGLGFGPDFSMQGTYCVDKQINNAEKGQLFNFGTTIATGTNVYFYVWAFLATPGLSDSLQNRGLAICLGTSTTAYTQFHVEGTDTYGAAGRVGKCYPIRYNTTANLSSIPYRTLNGSPGANPQYFGATANITGSVKSSNLGVDAIRYGDGIYITGGDSSTPASFTGASYYNDLVNNRYGVFTNVGSSYELQGKFVIGESTGLISAPCYFSDSNRFITVPNIYHVDSGFCKFIIDNPSTHFNLTNIATSALGTGNRGQLLYKNHLSESILDTCSFTDFGFVTLASGVTGSNCVWRRSDTVVQSGAKLDACTFERSFSSSALLSSRPDRISNCVFISRGTGYGIEIDTPGSYQFDGNVFTNYYTGASGNFGTEAIYNNSAGAVTLNIVNATIPSYRDGPGATTVLSASTQVTLVHIKDDSEVRIYEASTTTEIDGIETVADGTTDDRYFSFPASPGEFVDIVVFNTGYNYYRINSYEIPTSATELPIDQKQDRVYENP